MNGKRFRRLVYWMCWLPLVALGTVAGLPDPARADGGPAAVPAALLPPSTQPAAKDAAKAPPAEGEVVPTGCSSCGSGLLAPPPPPLGPPGIGPGIEPAPGIGCPSCCYPGRTGCDCCCNSDTKLGRFLGGLYECICCQDPCYEPSFIPLANAAFFSDSPRPVTQTRYRGDFAWDLPLPDKAEWIWARENMRGPRFPNQVAVPAGTLAPGEPRLLRRFEGSLYMEGATSRFGMFTELTYDYVKAEIYPGASGFGDMNLGTKSLLIDCDLLLLTFQFRTYLLTGNFTAGLGVGHVSLEPSLLLALKLRPTTYLQGQIAYLAPIGGDSQYEGPVFHYHFSLNQLLCACGKDIQLIGTLEGNAYQIAGGAYTDPISGQPLSARDVGNIFSAGPGIRLSVCNKVDFGMGSTFALSRDRFAGQWLRMELRWRF
jgi:hypothetical protein